MAVTFLTDEDGKLYVKTVNGVAPDENGNVEVEAGSGGNLDGAVLYTAQKPTEEQKAQARENIGAVSEKLFGDIAEQVDKLNAEIFPEPPKNLYDPSTITSGYIASAGGAIVTSTSYFTTDYIYVPAGQSILFTPQIRKFLAYREATKDPISTSHVANSTQNYVFTATENCYVRASFDTQFADVAWIKYVDVDYFNRINIASFGDSIAFGDGNGGTGIADVVADYLEAKVWEYAKGGATIGWDATDAESEHDAVKRQNIQYQVAKCISEHTDAPGIILLNGGTNDNGHGVELGEITVGYDAEIDNTTYCGGLETIIKTLKNAYPEAILIFVISHRMGSRNNEKQDSFAEKALEICNKWSVGVADVFHRSNFNTWLSAYHKYTNQTTDSPNGDKTHPTQEGYEKFYLPVVVDEIRRLKLLD